MYVGRCALLGDHTHTADPIHRYAELLRATAAHSSTLLYVGAEAKRNARKACNGVKHAGITGIASEAGKRVAYEGRANTINSTPPSRENAAF